MRLCTVDGCSEKLYAKGLCNCHYKRKRQFGDVQADKPILRFGLPIAERFAAKVDKDGPVPEYRPDLGPCWLWTDAPNHDGYGTLIVDRKVTGAHRISYELQVGPIPDGLVIDHLCRVRNCVNPAHLEPVTAEENTRRMREVKTHCKHGHEYTPENTRYTTQGYRFCRICRRRSERRMESQKRARAA